MSTLKKQNSQKESVIAFSITMAIFLLMVIAGWHDMNNPRTGVKDIVAYNSLSSHAIGMGNYAHNPTLSYPQTIPLEDQWWEGGLFLGERKLRFEEAYKYGIRAISIMHKNVYDPIAEKRFKVHAEPFKFDENGEDSIIEEDGWTIERYNLVAVKVN